MPTFERNDRVALLRATKGLPQGSVGSVLREELSNGERYYIVRWDDASEGSHQRMHRPTVLVAEADYQSAVTPEKEEVPANDFNRKLALLELDADAPTGFLALSAFSDNLRQIAETTAKLRALQKAVKNVPLYKGPELSLFLAIQGKDVHLVKEVDGTRESISIPLSVFARLMDTLGSGR
jgi:hypothetical protein